MRHLIEKDWSQERETRMNYGSAGCAAQKPSVRKSASTASGRTGSHPPPWRLVSVREFFRPRLLYSRRLNWRAIVIAGALGLAAPMMPSMSRAAQAAPAPASQIQPAAEALLQQSIQAMGGPAFLGFRTMSSSGRAFSIADGVTQGFVHYTSAASFPNRRRLSYGLSKRSKAVTLINNGDQGWEIDRYGLIEQPPKELRAWVFANRYSLENLLRLRIREPGMLIQKGKQDFVNNMTVQIVDMVDARQVRVKLYLSLATHLPHRIDVVTLDPETHQWNDYAEIYSDYQTVDGIETPMHLIRYFDGNRVAETFRSSVRYNETYPAGFFEPQGGGAAGK